MLIKKESQEKINEMKREYESFSVPTEALDRMKKGIRQAQEEDVKDKKKKGKGRYVWCKITGLTAAAAAIVFVILANTSADAAMAMEKIPIIRAVAKVVTFRDYQYEDERNMADVEIPEIISTKDPETALDNKTQENLENSAQMINQEIQEISDEFVKEFKENLENEQGYQDIMIKSEVMNTTEDYFTLKLICYQGAGSGAEWNYFYTIDLNTGERLALKNLFKEGADYITPISENIKMQMEEQMKEDDSKMYWLNDPEVEEWNFKEITDETEFYLNEENNIVISFNEGDVAPMYMGVVTFEIPDEVVKDIRK